MPDKTTTIRIPDVTMLVNMARGQRLLLRAIKDEYVARRCELLACFYEQWLEAYLRSLRN